MAPAVRTIFYSWQSDTPSGHNRSFIESALKEALATLNAGVINLEEADRPAGLALDKDTQDVAGSPPVFDTILKKIDACSVFIADVTFVAKSLPGLAKPKGGPRYVPNPNVMIEYGYALKRHGHTRVIGVMNTAYGKWDEKHLPFDMRHCRFPIRYRLDAQGAKTEERRRLTKVLAAAIGAVLKEAPASAAPPKFVPTDITAGAWSELAESGDLFSELGVSDDDPQPVIPAEGLCYLRFHPEAAVTSLGTPLDAREAAKANSLRPMGLNTHFPTRYSRNPRGAVAFQSAHSNILLGFTQLHRSKELFGADCTAMKTLSMRRGRDGLQPFDPIEVEASFAFSLEWYRRFAVHALGLAPPWTVTAGLYEVDGFEIMQNYRCLVPGFEKTIALDATTPTHQALLPFFLQMWKEFGIERPASANEDLLNHPAFTLLRKSPAS